MPTLDKLADVKGKKKKGKKTVAEVQHRELNAENGDSGLVEENSQKKGPKAKKEKKPKKQMNAIELVEMQLKKEKKETMQYEKSTQVKTISFICQFILIFNPIRICIFFYNLLNKKCRKYKKINLIHFG